MAKYKLNVAPDVDTDEPTDKAKALEKWEKENPQEQRIKQNEARMMDLLITPLAEKRKQRKARNPLDEKQNAVTEKMPSKYNEMLNEMITKRKTEDKKYYDLLCLEMSKASNSVIEKFFKIVEQQEKELDEFKRNEKRNREKEEIKHKRKQELLNKFFYGQTFDPDTSRALRDWLFESSIEQIENRFDAMSKRGNIEPSMEKKAPQEPKKKEINYELYAMIGEIVRLEIEKMVEEKREKESSGT
jgi:hypothetical protein